MKHTVTHLHFEQLGNTVLNFVSDQTHEGTNEPMKASTPFIYEGHLCEVTERDIQFYSDWPQVPQIIAYANRRLFDTRIVNDESLGLNARQILLTDKMLRENSRSILRDSRCADISFEFEQYINDVIAAIPQEEIAKRIKPEYFNFAYKEAAVA